MEFQTLWGSLIAWYLFLAGAGAGAYLVSYVADRLGEHYRPLNWPGVFLGAPLVAAGAMLLLFHLGNPLQVWRAVSRPFNSMMSLGIWILLVFIILAALHLGTYLWPKIFKFGERTLSWIKGGAAVFAVATAIYTGLLLGVVKAIPFWNTPVLPLLFLVSALSTGIAGVLLVAAVLRLLQPKSEHTRAFGEGMHGLGRWDAWLIAIEALVLFVLIFVMIAGSAIEAGSARFLVNGGFKLPFWLGLVVVGLLVPFVLELWTTARSAKQNSSSFSLIAVLTALCVLIGGLVMRFAILSAGINVSGLL